VLPRSSPSAGSTSFATTGTTVTEIILFSGVPSELEHYRHSFTHLHCQVSRDQWPLSPKHRAPYKPLLLLALLDLIDAGRLQPGELIAVEDLGERFFSYCTDLAELGWKTERARLVYPSFHLRFDGFWRLVPRPGRESALSAASGPTDFGTWDRSVVGVTLEPELVVLLADAVARADLRNALLNEYFGVVERQRLVTNEGAWNVEDVAFSSRIQTLLAQPFSMFHSPAGTQTVTRKVRDRVFRLWVVPAYDHTCAVCGLRVLTPEGRSPVEAAHIVKHSESNNDDPRNGIAMCGVHHWAFDEGLIAIGERTEILISRVLPREDERAELITRFRRRRLRQPGKQQLQAAPEALAWHREHVFRTVA
jgi:putative restriction endonuclease